VSEPERKARLVVDLVSGTVTHHLLVRVDEPLDVVALERGVLRLLADR
jgi:hypothetical protein